MIRSIMVPLDGSHFAEWALPRAVALARPAGSSIELVSVHVPFALRATPDGSGFTVEMDESAARMLQTYLGETCARIAAVTDGKVTTTVLTGPVRDELIEHAERMNPDLIVMTTHGRGALQRLWLGSVADALVRHARQPVLLVRPEEDAVIDPGAGEVFRNILVPLDGSQNAEAILPTVFELGDPSHAAYTFVQIVQPPYVMSSPYGAFPPPRPDDRLLNDLCVAAEAYLADVAREHAKPQRRITTHVGVDSMVAGAILAEAERSNADLVAIATHGRGAVGRFVLGSIADKVVRGARTATLVHRAHT